MIADIRRLQEESRVDGLRQYCVTPRARGLHPGGHRTASTISQTPYRCLTASTGWFPSAGSLPWPARRTGGLSRTNDFSLIVPIVPTWQ